MVKLPASFNAIEFEAPPPRHVEAEHATTPNGHDTTNGHDKMASGKPWKAPRTSTSPLALLSPVEANALALKAPGALGRFVRWSLRSAPYPQPMLTLGAGLCLFGTLMGQRYRLVGGGPDTRSNLYVFAVAESAAGKDHPRKCAKAVLTKMRLYDYFGEELRSDAALHNATWRTNVCVYLIDEIGSFVEAVLNSRGASPFYTQIMSKLTTFWSSADQLVKEPVKADVRDEDHEYKNIDQPCVSVYGSTVPHRLWEAIGSGNFSDGSIPRFLLFNAGNIIPRRNKDALDRRAGLEAIAADAWEIMTRGNRSPTLEDMKRAADETRLPPLEEVEEVDDDGKKSTKSVRPEKPEPNLTDVGFEADALAYQDTVADLKDKLAQEHAGRPTGAVVGRLWEQVRRVALIAAVADNPQSPVVKLAHVQWADKVVRWSIAHMLHAVDKHVADTPLEAKSKKVLNIIRDEAAKASDGWASCSAITNRIRFVSGRDRADLIATLVEAGQVEVRMGEKPATGPAPAFYRVAS